MVDSKYLVQSLATPCVYYDPEFLPEQDAEAYYQDLLKNIKWEKTSKINRWVSLHHEEGLDNYQYRDAPGAANIGFNEVLQKIKEQAEDWCFQQTSEQVTFNVCLLNYYEDGQQRIGWHSDREEIGRSTPIASVTLGTTRQFLIRSKEQGVHDRASFDLVNGSMVVMENICQHQYVHSVPKQPEVTSGRINLTFRCKEHTTAGEEEHERRDDWLKNITDGAAPDSLAWSSVVPSAASHIFGDDVQIGELDPGYSIIHYVIKTNLGAERYCAAEIQEVLNGADLIEEWKVVAQPQGMDGFVACAAPMEAVSSEILQKTASVLLKLKSAHHVMKYHTDFSLEECVTDEFPTPQLVTATTMYDYFKKQLGEKRVRISSLEDLETGTFRATCERIGGPHAFQRPEVESEMGGAMAEYFYPKLRPKMEDYDVCVRVDIVGYRVIVGTQLNVCDLSKDRHFLKFRNAVTVKTNLAYAMVRLANLQPGACIADPFCGSGTIVLEALEVCKKQVYCVGMDVSKRSANGARENAVAENCGDDVCKFVCSDARGLRRHLEDDSVDAIVSNLPWGVMTGQTSDLKTLYEIFLRNSWYVLKPGGRVVMLVLRGLQVTRIVRKLSGRYRLLSVNVVRTTNNLPCIIVIEKLAADELRESIKGQLAYMNQYVNVSPEIYQAIHTEDIDDEEA
jgi:tRNA G10  N-methylase Trm11/alkylated DNA repair dioxygenase AlkB